MAKGDRGEGKGSRGAWSGTRQGRYRRDGRTEKGIDNNTKNMAHGMKYRKGGRKKAANRGRNSGKAAKQ